MSNEEIIKTISRLSKKLSLYLLDAGDLTYAELELAESLADWYVTKGIPLIAQRASERAATTPVEIDEYTVTVKWGGKDGKWRWLAEASDGQARAGEERMLVGALSAGSQAAVNFPHL